MAGVYNGSHENDTIKDRDYNESWTEYTDLDKVIIPIIMPIVVTIGVIGNLLTIIVIARKKCMHTPVKMYFANLAIADTLYLITAPDLAWNSYIQSPVIDYYDIGEVPNWVCPLHRFFVNALIDVALFTIFWLSVERYMEICRPLKFKQSGFGICSRSVKICGIIWFLCLSWNVYFLVEIREVISWHRTSVDVLQKFVACRPSEFEYSEIQWHVNLVLTVLMIVIIIALHIAVLMSLRTSRIVTSSARRKSISKSELKLFLTLFVTVTVYVIFMVPFYTYLLLKHHTQIRPTITIVRLMTCINSSVNPVIYNAMNYNFRRAFCDVYFSRCNRKKNTPTNVRSSHQKQND